MLGWVLLMRDAIINLRVNVIKYNSKLTKRIVKEIRNDYPSISKSKLAKKYNVNCGTICDVIAFRTWKVGRNEIH